MLNTLIVELFYSVKKIREKIEEYKEIPIKHFINENYFLYDKSNLIKKLLLPLTSNYLCMVLLVIFREKLAFQT